MQGVKYWIDRYKKGGDSGAGSKGRLAEFKADIINQFIKEHNITTVLDLGCGDGMQAELIKAPFYVGVDISFDALKMCEQRFQGDPAYIFISYSLLTMYNKADLTLSLDVIYHLIDDKTFTQYMKSLFYYAQRYVIIYACDFYAPGEPGFAPWIKPRKFTDYVDVHLLGFELVKRIPNKYPFDVNDLVNTSFSEFFIYERTKQGL